MTSAPRGVRLFLQKALCTLLSLIIAVQPAYQATLYATLLGILSSPLAVLAQTSPPPPLPPGASPPLPDTAPPGAQDGKALGESLLRGPSTDGNKIYFNGASGTESINTGDLFQSAGSADDLKAMQDAFGDDNAAAALSTAVAARLGTEKSQQANAVQTVRESALTHSHPDLGNDPVFNRSKDLMQGTDPIFSTFFSGCSSTDVPTSGGSTVHVPDDRYCSRVVTPAEHCEITHDYNTGLVGLVAGEGGVQSCGDGCLDVYVGKVGDNYWAGNCTIFEQTVHLQIDNGAAITSATLVEAKWDDYMQILLGGKKVWQGPNDSFPPETAGPCDLKTSWDQTTNVDLTRQFQQDGLLEFLIRVSVGGNGEGYARIRITYDKHKLVTQDQWNISPECKALLDGLSDKACTLTKMDCLDGPAMDVPCIDVNGFQICQGDLSPGPLPGYSPLCRHGEINGNCQFMTGQMQCWTDPQGTQHCPTNDGSNPDGCSIFENDPKCGFISSECLSFAQGASGRCYAFDEKWDCGSDVALPGGSASKVKCDGPIRCMGEECVSPPREANPDFGKAAATLSAVTFMSMDMNCVDGNPDSCKIFSGEAMECKQALGGYKDCCNTPVGVGLADYLKLTMASYDLTKKLGLVTKLAATGENNPGAWSAVKNFADASWEKITGQSFSTSWDSLTQSYGGALEKLGLNEIKKEITKETAQFVADHFGAETAQIFFGGTTDEATNQFTADGTLSEGFSSALGVIMWAYTIYVIVNILINIIWACEQQEFLLNARREMKACTYVGSYCKQNTIFGCIETEQSYCCYNSPLARIVMEGAKSQLNLDLGAPQTPNCQGLTIAQMASLDWDKIDLQQWYGILAANGQIPNNPGAFNTQYALDNVTRNQLATFPAPSAPERLQNEVDAAQYFDEARAKVREDLWNAAH